MSAPAAKKVKFEYTTVDDDTDEELELGPYYSQEKAFRYADRVNEKLHARPVAMEQPPYDNSNGEHRIFASEVNKCGKRMYISCTYASFFDMYAKLRYDEPRRISPTDTTCRSDDEQNPHQSLSRHERFFIHLFSLLIYNRLSDM